MANQTQSTDHYDNPYFLHRSDHAGLILVSDRLATGADFHSWRRSMRMALNDERQKNIKPKPENVIFQASDNVQHMNTNDQTAYSGPYENTACAVQNSFRPRSSRPLCTHCGQTGHVIQRCYKLHGYPPGYIPGFKSNAGFQSYQRPTSQQFQAITPFQSPANQFQTRGQTSVNQPRFQNHAVANVMTGPSFQYMPPPAVQVSNMDVNQMSGDQVQQLIQQLNARVQVSEVQAPSPPVSSITEKGVMDPQSSSGFWSDSLTP
ncbi:unnamed protein product [Arabidopsis halleri]